MPIVVRISIEDDKTLAAPKQYQVFLIFLLLCRSAEETSGFLFTQDEFLSPRCPQFVQEYLLMLLVSTWRIH